MTSARSGLSDEVELVERARTSLATGNVAAARSALDEHAQKFPRGVLADEASVLRVDVLATSGDHVGARRAARAYLTAHPASPHAPRLREYVGGGVP
jgi:outer membrane protein assembly factor BamD (BamD/ComL family)